MADGSDSQTARTARAIKEIGRTPWNDCASPPDQPYNPFISYDFLAALEDSGSVGGASGWEPLHIALEKPGSTVGVTPLYLKSHSQGEYVFDHHWADAYQRVGGRYYPKLTCATPFTPVPARRLLAQEPLHIRTLGAAIREIGVQIGASSAHANFISEGETDALSELGFLRRLGIQYHWFNRDYQTFDDFLGALSSRKRKAIRREREAAGESGLEFSRLSGPEIQEKHWDAFWDFYQDTGSRKWGRPYLTRKFFSLIGERMASDVLLVLATRNGAPIAGALNFIGGDALYGRYWGCTEYHPFLHFELCYYQAIEFAIERGFVRVEAGAQGEHKVARGYEPIQTYSAHWIADRNFRTAIDRYLAEERLQIAAEIEAIKEAGPYRRKADNG